MVIEGDESITVERVLAEWKERGIRNVRFELPDMHGTNRILGVAFVDGLGLVDTIRAGSRLAGSSPNRQNAGRDQAHLRCLDAPHLIADGPPSTTVADGIKVKSEEQRNSA